MSDSGPLTPEQIDLLISADLDGEFDAAASDLGLEPGAARTFLESNADAQARRGSLARARDLLAEPIEIDELLAARLRTKAAKAAVEAAEEDRHAQRTRRTRRYGIVSGVAAAFIVVVALGANLGSNGSDSDGSSAIAGSAADRAPAASPTVASSAAPEAALDSARNLPLAASYATVDDLAAAVRARGLATYADEALPLESDQASAGSDPDPQEECRLVAQGMQGASEAPVAKAATEVDGEPLSVLVYDGTGGRTVYVFDTECNLVTRQLVR